MEESPKIGLVEIILMNMIVIPADLFELAATLLVAIPVLGQILLVVKWIVAGFTWLIIQFWLIMKGIKGLWYLSGSLLDGAANFLGLDLPFGKTVSLNVTIYLANHPKITQVAAVASGKIGAATEKITKQ
ncbi:MAG: hypothetical protein Q8N22_02070 [bacterium]|nr:hypothetical protein [bacterium]